MDPMALKRTINRVLGDGDAASGRRVRAVGDGVTVAESDHYFPVERVDRAHLRDSSGHTVCAWKGTASYFDVIVADKVNRGAAWYNPEPKPAATEVKDRIVFWRGVRLEPVPVEVPANG